MALIGIGRRGEAPAASFAEPVAMLIACHDRVRHFAATVERLAAHLTQHGSDAAAREAAAGVLRYFDLAAPLHHEDEEVDLFPALLDVLDPTRDADALASLRRLTAEHEELAALYRVVRLTLERVAAGEPAEFAPGAAERFAQRYPAHAAVEEESVFPLAQARLAPEVLTAIGRRMAERRGLRE